MSMFTLAISCLTTSNLPRFMDLTGEGNGTPLQYSCLENPMDRGAWWAAIYGVTQSWTQLKQLSSSSSMQYCCLQHRTLLLSPVTSTTGWWFCFGSICSFFLELFLHWSPIAYWAPTNLGSSSFSTLSLCLFILFMGFSRQEYWSGLPFPSPVDHILSELSTMTRVICYIRLNITYKLLKSRVHHLNISCVFTGSPVLSLIFFSGARLWVWSFRWIPFIAATMIRNLLCLQVVIGELEQL